MNHRLPLSSLKFIIPALCALSLATAATAAANGTAVYRCGGAGGSYSQTPCSGGVPMELDDRRSDSQRREAEANTRRDQALADRLRKERREQEAAYAAAPKGAAGIRGVPAHQASPSHLDEWQRLSGPKPKHAAKRKKQNKPALGAAG